MKSTALSFVFFLTIIGSIHSQSNARRFIRLDQFGYFCTSAKKAIIINPINGYDGGDSFTPDTGTDGYELRKYGTNETVFSGTLAAWNNENTHSQSGDKGWYFDFSEFTEPGIYYIYDVANAVSSYPFEISESCYDLLQYHASRFYFYQRCNFAKNTPYAESPWTDAAAFERSNQDHFSRSRYGKNDPSTARDISGGWFDAGDYNKYVTFAIQPICVLLDAYQRYPDAFSDALNIPESGNGIADILDEVKYEIDWLERMQDATGTDGLLLKVGVDTYDNTGSPPNTDANPRYYVPECTSSTLGGAAMMAIAYTVFKDIPAWSTYASNLKTRAASAWTRAVSTTNNFTTFESDCDDQDIKSGDADQSAETQMQTAVVAAIYLYEAFYGSSDAAQYKTFVENNYLNINPMANYWWGPYDVHVENALLHYTTLPGIDQTVANNIRDRKTNSSTGMGIDEYNNQTDLYLSYMPDDQYHWGSSQVKATLGINMLNYIYYNLDTPNNDDYYKTAESYLHWFHGQNAQGVVLISNMYSSGGDSCINEVYHSWFADGTDFDNTKTSAYGPAPGFIPGGPNKNYEVSQINPPYGQPPQKSYKDWNTAWNGSYQESSYEVTEVSIYVQACYLSLLAAIRHNAPPVGTCDIPLGVNLLSFDARQKNNDVVLKWSEQGAFKSEIQRSSDLYTFKKIGSVNAGIFTFIDSNVSAGNYYYRIQFSDSNQQSFYSPIAQVNILPAIPLTIWFDPTNRTFNIENKTDRPILFFCRMANVLGTSIFTRQLMTHPRSTASVRLSDLPPGIYIYSLSNGQNNTSGKLFITNDQ